MLTLILLSPFTSVLPEQGWVCAGLPACSGNLLVLLPLRNAAQVSSCVVLNSALTSFSPNIWVVFLAFPSRANRCSQLKNPTIAVCRGAGATAHVHGQPALSPRGSDGNANQSSSCPCGDGVPMATATITSPAPVGQALAQHWELLFSAAGLGLFPSPLGSSQGPFPSAVSVELVVTMLRLLYGFHSPSGLKLCKNNCWYG